MLRYTLFATLLSLFRQKAKGSVGWSVAKVSKRSCSLDYSAKTIEDLWFLQSTGGLVVDSNEMCGWSGCSPFQMVGFGQLACPMVPPLLVSCHIHSKSLPETVCLECQADLAAWRLIPDVDSSSADTEAYADPARKCL